MGKKSDIVGGNALDNAKIVMGILYFFTGAFFGIGWVIDFFGLIFKPNPYYV